MDQGFVKTWPVHALCVGAFDVMLAAPDAPDDLVRHAERAGDASSAYWAHVWPASRMLAEAIARTSLISQGTRVLEVGCGLGLVGVVASRRGARVVMTDVREEAVQAARWNAAINGVDSVCAVFDWNEAPDDAWSPDLLIASDVLYDDDAPHAIARLMTRLGCAAMLGAPNRDSTWRAIETLRTLGMRIWDAPAPQGRVLLVQSQA